MQFALYCGFKKIYLVGCDCGQYDQEGKNGTAKYFFKNDGGSKLNQYTIDRWKKIYQLKNNHYPKAQIINMNPVGLKGLMDDDIFTTHS